jgi:hypothetical protein
MGMKGTLERRQMLTKFGKISRGKEIARVIKG